ncbi:MAG TPA: response regulator, partial [Syntrophorhabdus sp.]|nr:response regulator [Syntrophorhabdus sp.]
GVIMSKSILDGRQILLVDDEPDILSVLEEEIKLDCPRCTIDKATTYEQAHSLLRKNDYDVVVLDIMGVRGFDLLEEAIKRKMRVAMLTAHALSPEAMKKSHDLGARAYLPKDKLGEIVPFLEDLLQYESKAGWKRLFDKLEDFFDGRFEGDWKEKSGIPYW